MAQQQETFTNFNFIVEIDGITIASFLEVSGLESTIEVIEYSVGNSPGLPVQKIPGRTRYSNLVLKSGVTDNDELFKWHQEWASGATTDRKQVRIVLMDAGGIEKRSWRIRRAWPAKYVGPTFNALANEVAIETIELAHEGFE